MRGLNEIDDALRAFASTLTPDIAQAISDALVGVPRNDHAWTYTIRGFDGSDYITRTLLPRLAGLRPLIHRIHREDADPYMHNHPWQTARFVILSGGYSEERKLGNSTQYRFLRPGDINELNAETFHRVGHVEPNTWTLGLVGERVQDWGFLVDGEFVLSADYFARKGYSSNGGLT